MFADPLDSSQINALQESEREITSLKEQNKMLKDENVLISQDYEIKTSDMKMDFRDQIVEANN